MTSMFDYDDSVNLAYKAKQAGKNLVTAKHELLERTGEFLFMAHSDREFALRCQMVEQDIEGIAFRRLASLSDSKAKLVHAAYDEWKLRHASCEMCKIAKPEIEFSITGDPSDVLSMQRSETAPLHQQGSGACKTCGGRTQNPGDYQCSACEKAVSHVKLTPAKLHNIDISQNINGEIRNYDGMR
jgi:hypothetical protein